MATGDDDLDADDGPVLAPEELDITEDEHVREIDEGRFVISPEGRPAVDVPESDSPDDRADALDETTVHAWLRERMAASSSRYGFDVTGRFDGRVSHQQIASNDIVTVFETLMLWYARQVDRDTPVEEVIGILLMESNVPVRYPAGSIETLLESVDVDEEDSVASLLEAVEARDGIQL